MPSESAVHVQLLGTFEVRVGGEPVVLTGARARTLLTVLALSAGKVVTADTLTDRIWGQAPPADPKASLYNAIRRLRQLLGDATISTEPLGYRLNVEQHQVDALAFSRSAAEAGSADGAVRRLAVDRALSLWGEPFQGDTSDWLRYFEAPRLTETYLAVLEQRIDLDLADAKHANLTAELADLTNRYRLRESLWARRLIALSGAGRQAEALELYGEVRTSIADELGVDPGPELQAVYQSLLTPDRPAPKAAEPQQLPPDLRHFTGRTDILATLDALTARTTTSSDAPTVSVVLHGEGGVGKTSLAVRWAHQQSDRFPDGRFFLRLRGYGPSDPVTPSAALEYLLRSLGFVGAAIPDELEDRTALCRTTLARRRVLLLLDDARDAEQVRPLLPATGAVVLITSRSQLRGLTIRDGASPVRVTELSVAEARALLAAAVDGRRELPGDEELTELAARCCQLPLPLAIVGERLAREPELAVGEIIHQLRDEADRLNVLDTGEDSATELRAVFSWSYQVLEPDAARLFRLLALHPGTTIGVPAAAALAGTTIPSARRLLDRLVSYHLLRQPDEIRFQLHDLLRAYATEQSALTDTESDRATARNRLFDWYLFTAASARDTLALNIPVDLGQPDPHVTPVTFDAERDAMRWFDAEHSALTGAIRRAAAIGLHAVACQLGLMMRLYLAARFSAGESVRAAHFGLDQAQLSGSPGLQAHAANHLGVALARSGQLDQSLPYLELATDRFAQAGDRDGELGAINNIGTVYLLLGHSDSLLYLRRALELAKEQRRVESVLVAETNLCGAYLKLNRSKEALPHGRASVELARAIGQRAELAVALDGLGEALSRTGQHDAGIAALREALDMTIEIDTPTGIAISQISLGNAYALAGDRTAAAACYRDALTTFDTHKFTGNVDRVTREDIVALLDSTEDAISA